MLSNIENKLKIKNILRKGPYIVDLESVGWTGKYANRYDELYVLVYHLD